MSKKANMGKVLEDKIIKQSAFYLEKDMASFRKTPNNWVVKRNGPHIVGANPIPSGLCDFIGTSKRLNGRLIVFDAKETKNKTSFPLKNIKPGQMDHMKQTVDHGGIAFLIVWFTEINETYYVPYEFILPYWEDAETHPGERGFQSIKLFDIRANCDLIDDMEFLSKIKG